MAIKGVLFDFSGTLLRIESTEAWLRAVLDETGTELSEAEFLRCAAELDHVGALPGGTAHPRVPEHLRELWEVRDESAEKHRAAYTGLSNVVRLPAPHLHEALYDRHRTPPAWGPYPDTVRVLEGLRERGVLVGVVSNIGWDLRPVFREHGLDPYVDAYVLSYEHGIQKPDPRLFAVALERLGVAPADTLMVGDDRRADGGAAQLGCAVHFVDHLPAHERPGQLLPVLDLVDASAA
ncbi:HAD family hydrolase [Streptomyces indicus]|uniref:Putative hydrolase of the HAD superfamily n=1 Tax=Streptomyces indicus TaxID=417292 RepID=A0A1G8TI17_9ACTN|nr:HAD-IA family hydrolase [Streptomyces indicus]SDJ40565.1 putative hydrolase of the HAD superfamily [Streptomyces indicus]